MQKQHTILQWAFPEYEIPHRGTAWYVVAGLVVGLLIVWSISQQNYTFPLLIIMVTIILFAHTLQTPLTLNCRITSEGISVGDTMYPFPDLESFWIVETAVGEVLYFQNRRGMKRVTKVPLQTQDADNVRTFLQQYVEENQEYTNEPLGDWLTRRLRL